MRYVMLLVLLLAMSQIVGAVDIELFSIPDCKPCEDAKDYLAYLDSRMPDLNIIEYNESYVGGSDIDYFEETAERIGIKTDLVPVIVVGDTDYHIGYVSDSVDGEKIKEIILVNKVLDAYEPEPEEPEIEEVELVLKLFWAVGCPHCEDEKEFLESIKGNYPNLKIELYEVGYNETNQDILIALADELDFEPGSVPITVIEDWHRVGYSGDNVEGKLIESVIIRKIAEKSGDLGTDELDDLDDTISSLESTVEIPFVGKVNINRMMGEMGIPVSTIMLGLIDGFNPCAFFVLTMLLVFMAHAKSRKRMLLVGFTFVLISGIIYFLSMSALFTAISSIDDIHIVAIIGGIIALIIGAINLKEFFFFKKGASLTISEGHKSDLMKRMRNIFKSEGLAPLLIGTVVLATVANLYELLCTLGIPVVYTNYLNTQGLDFFTNYAYIALYNVFYVLPLLTIVIIFAKNMGGKKMTQETGETLKAISGIMMLGFGFFLITDLRILSNFFIIGGLIITSIILGFIMTRIKARRKEKSMDEQESKETKKEPKKEPKKNGPAKESEV